MINKKLLMCISLFCVFTINGCSSSNNASTSSAEVNQTVSNDSTASSDSIDSNQSDSNAKNNKTTENKFNTYDSSVNLVNDNRGIPTLYYHSVRETEDNEVTISPKKLKEQLEYIKNQGYTTLTIDQLNDYILNNASIPEKSILITFDDGYMDNYTYAFPILKELNMTATIFCITNELDGSYYLSHEAIKEMSDYGICIESHTVTHSHLNTLSYDEQLKEMKESKETLESITGRTINSIAFPFGDYNSDSLKAAKNSGYKIAFTTNQGIAKRETNPLELDRIYISSAYDMNTFKTLLNDTYK